MPTNRSTLLCVVVYVLASSTWAQSSRAAGGAWDPPGTPRSYRRISPFETPFPNTLTRSQLGSGLAQIGDLDGNGVADVAIGAEADSPPHECREGALWIQFMQAGGATSAQRRIRPGESDFTGALAPGDEFGADVAGIGDLDGDGIPDLAVGAPGDDSLVVEGGALWLLYLRADGRVKGHVKLLPPLAEPEFLVSGFGQGLAHLGDLDGDGVTELAVGASTGNRAGEEGGAVWILSLEPDGDLLRATKVSALAGGFLGNLDVGDDFGVGLARGADLDGNGVADLLVGAPGDDDFRADSGALWRLSLAPDGSVASHLKISSISGGGPVLGFREAFGASVTEIGLLDLDGIPDLAVGAPSEGLEGSLYILRISADGSAHTTRRLNPPQDLSSLEAPEGLGAAVAPLGDLDGNGIPEVLVSAPGFPEELRFGFVWRFDLRRDASLRSSRPYGVRGWSAPAYLATPTSSDFGMALATHRDGVPAGELDVLVGQARDDALWRLRLDATRAVVRAEKWSAATGFPAGLATGDRFGSAVVVVGDVDGNGHHDLAVGAYGDRGGNSTGEYGAVWILFLGPDGAVLGTTQISHDQGGLVTNLTSETQFGSALAPLGDLDGDGVPDLAVGAPGRSIPLSSKGSVFVLFLNPDGSVKAETRFFSFDAFDDFQRFGHSLAPLGGGRLLVGQPVRGTGRLYVTELDDAGIPLWHAQIGPETHALGGTAASSTLFGYSLATVGDLDGDGLAEVAVGTLFEITAGHPLNTSGVLRILFLSPTLGLRRHLLVGPGHPAVTQIVEGFAAGLGPAGDVDGDGVPDLLVGNPSDLAFASDCEVGIGSFGLLRLGGPPVVRGF